MRHHWHLALASLAAATALLVEAEAEVAVALAAVTLVAVTQAVAILGAAIQQQLGQVSISCNTFNAILLQHLLFIILLMGQASTFFTAIQFMNDCFSMCC